MSAASFCTVTASTKRNASLGSGRTGAAATQIASLLVTNLWPIGGNVVQELGLSGSAREYKQVFHVPADGTTALPDVVEGDILTLAGADYPIAAVEEWTDGDVPCLKITIQQVKGT